MTTEQVNITILSPVGTYRHPYNTHAIQVLSAHYNVELVQVHGMSDVTAARNTVATTAYPIIKKRGGVVLWLDADMTIKDLDTFRLHIALTMATGKAISGRAVIRQDHTKVAATIDPDEVREPEEHLLDPEGTRALLTPVVPGLGCLMLPAPLWLIQADNSPARLKDGKVVARYVCCPEVVGSSREGEEYEYVSEDNVYCMSIPGGAWYATVIDTFNKASYLDYGHVAERILMHSQSPHNMNPSED